MVVAHTVHRLQLVSLTKATLLEFKLDTEDVMHYKQSVVKNTQTLQHNAVEQHENEKLKQNWKDDVQLIDE